MTHKESIKKILSLVEAELDIIRGHDDLLEQYYHGQIIAYKRALDILNMKETSP